MPYPWMDFLVTNTSRNQTTTLWYDGFVAATEGVLSNDQGMTILEIASIELGVTTTDIPYACLSPTASACRPNPPDLQKTKTSRRVSVAEQSAVDAAAKFSKARYDIENWPDRRESRQVSLSLAALAIALGLHWISGLRFEQRRMPHTWGGQASCRSSQMPANAGYDASDQRLSEDQPDR
ncbi:hypothetical protein AYL99_04986 [Fonsecaea erecta]|uniref:Uncharacterized protein n=1 Tax=Fonsecaea erecta TaxID=1367422 RepID=A0A178ZJL3_9EURO|nr:hypothetical protein AYL99_04986 [Fonsecaea erecta]OAP59984.1 hypothetical protein AYL99_04986 [Fonsecaea erecta]